MSTTKRGLRAAMTLAVAAAIMTTLPTPAGAATTRGKFVTLPDGENMGFEITGAASLTRTRHGTVARAVVKGLEEGVTYAAHVHNQPCEEGLGGGHYKDDPEGPPAPPNELWLSSSDDPRGGIVANSAGVARGRGRADWVAREDAVSIVIHFIPEGGTTAGGPKIACADLALRSALADRAPADGRAGPGGRA